LHIFGGKRLNSEATLELGRAEHHIACQRTEQWLFALMHAIISLDHQVELVECMLNFEVSVCWGQFELQH
jgi:hypothetical protein